MNMAINFRFLRGIFPDLPIPMQIAISWLPNLSHLSLTNCSFSLRVQKLRISKETLRFLNFLKMLIGNETNEYFGCLPRTDTFEPMNVFC